MASLRGLFIVSLALTSGCLYGFDNPVQNLDSGVVAGKVLAPAGGQSTAGGTVHLLWSGLTATLDSSGQFAFLDLPESTYGLLVAVPQLPGMANSASVAERFGLRLGLAGGAVDAVDVGTLQLQVAATVTGSVAGAVGPAVLGAFAPADGGLGLFEGLATAVAADGTFTLRLPAGDHVLAASDASQSTQLAVHLAPGLSQQVALTLAPAVMAASVEGTLVLGGPARGASAQPGDVNPVLAQISYEVRDPSEALVSTGSLFSSPTQIPGSGATFDVAVPPGQLVSVKLLLPPSAPVEFASLGIEGVPGIAGATTVLGTVTWLTQTELSANGPADAGTAIDGGTDAGL